MKHRPLRWLAVLLAFTFLAAACGGETSSDDEVDTTDSSPDDSTPDDTTPDDTTPDDTTPDGAHCRGLSALVTP